MSNQTPNSRDPDVTRSTHASLTVTLAINQKIKQVYLQDKATTKG